MSSDFDLMILANVLALVLVFILVVVVLFNLVVVRPNSTIEQDNSK